MTSQCWRSQTINSHGTDLACIDRGTQADQFRKTPYLIYVFAFYKITWHWKGPSCWNPPQWNIKASLDIENYACWWFGNVRNLSISRHGIDHVCKECFITMILATNTSYNCTYLVPWQQSWQWWISWKSQERSAGCWAWLWCRNGSLDCILFLCHPIESLEYHLHGTKRLIIKMWLMGMKIKWRHMLLTKVQGPCRAPSHDLMVGILLLDHGSSPWPPGSQNPNKWWKSINKFTTGVYVKLSKVMSFHNLPIFMMDLLRMGSSEGSSFSWTFFSKTGMPCWMAISNVCM